MSLSLKSLDERLAAVEAKLEEYAKTPEQSKVAAPPLGHSPEPVAVQSPNPIPVEYRDIVDTELNRSFGITIETRTDAPLFTFTIVVPDKYSSMTPGQRELQQQDIRPKVLSFGDGSTGVREWAQRVFNSFSPELKAQIVADRVTFQ
jgi:hypothetical protein